MPFYKSKFTLTGRMPMEGTEAVFSVELPMIKAQNGKDAAKKARKYVETHARKIFQNLIDVGNIEVTGDAITMDNWREKRRALKKEQKENREKPQHDGSK